MGFWNFQEIALNPHLGCDQPFMTGDRQKSALNKSIQVTGLWETTFIKFCLRLSTLWVAISYFRSFRKAVRALRHLVSYRKSLQGDKGPLKYAKAHGKYHLSLNMPAWPSKAWFAFLRNELSRLDPMGTANTHIQTMVFTVTKQCSLSCEHCFEWENLNQPESLSLNDLKHVLDKFQKNGLSQVQISGGEPLRRIDDVLQLVEDSPKTSEFWLLSSGVGLTPSVAKDLKKAGFNGVNLSLDHWIEAQHNQFRGNDESYNWVMKAARNVVQADLQLCLSLCATREFTTLENLWRYAELSRELNAGIVQILEPRASGRYANTDVELTGVQVEMLRDFYLSMNTERVNRSYPLFQYPGYHQRKYGCFGAGLRFLYMDPCGNLHACPFCRNPMGNCLTGEISNLIKNTQQEGCLAFQMAPADHLQTYSTKV